MSETGTMVRIVMALGMLFIVMGLLNPGDDAAWTEFQAATSVELVVPEFQNPFPSEFLRAQLTSTNYSTSINAVGTNCAVGDFFSGYNASECVQPPYVDATGSWYTDMITGVPPVAVAVMVLPDLPDYTPTTVPHVASLVLHVVCRSQARVEIVASISGFGEAGEFSKEFCSRTGNFEDKQVSWKFNYNNTWNALDLGPGAINIRFFSNVDGLSDPTGFVDVAYVQLDIYTTTQEDCYAPPGAWLPGLDIFVCSISRTLTSIWQGFMYVINGVVWVIQTAVAVAAFVGRIVVSLFVAMITMVTLMFAIPGAPAIVQALIDIVLVGLIVFVLMTVVKLVRGSSGGM